MNFYRRRSSEDVNSEINIDKPMKNAFRIHQLMVIAADFACIKLICDAPETLGFGVDYRVPRDVYPSELRAIESP